MTTVHEVNEERKAAHGTLDNTYAMFPVGAKVQVIIKAQDFCFFSGRETGTVIRNGERYLSIIVGFDEPISFIGGLIEEFNFEPSDLIILPPRQPQQRVAPPGTDFSPFGGGWNFRIIRHPPCGPDPGCLEWAEVYYDKQDHPHAWGRACTIADDIDGFRWILGELGKALEKPVLLFKDGKLREE